VAPVVKLLVQNYGEIESTNEVSQINGHKWEAWASWNYNDRWAVFKFIIYGCNI